MGEETQKIELRVPAALKRQAESAARQHGDGDVSSWVRGLIRDKVRELGIAETVAPPPPAPKKPAARAKKKESGR